MARIIQKHITHYLPFDSSLMQVASFIKSVRWWRPPLANLWK